MMKHLLLAVCMAVLVAAFVWLMFSAIYPPCEVGVDPDAAYVRLCRIAPVPPA